jgi:hypothetical protein
VNYKIIDNYTVARGSLVVEALYYKPEGSGLRSDEVNEFFSSYLFLPATLGPGIYSASNRSDYQKQKNYVSWENRAAGA